MYSHNRQLKGHLHWQNYLQKHPMMLCIGYATPTFLGPHLGNGALKGLISFCAIPSKVAKVAKVNRFGIMMNQNCVRLCKKTLLCQQCLIFGHKGSLLVLLVYDKDKEFYFILGNVWICPQASDKIS